MVSIFSSSEVKDIYDNYSYHWSNSLKEVSSNRLAKSIEEIVNNEKNDTRLWNFSERMLSELDVRKYAIKHSKEMKIFREKITSQTNDCLIGSSYNIEAAGISESSVRRHGSKKKTIHPYSQSPVAKKIVERWKNSKSNKSLDKYIAKKASDEDKKALRKANVKYVSPPERKHYRVTFDSGKVKIGGKYPEDGKYIFALSLDGKELLAGSKEKGKFHHSSFYAGGPVGCPGDFDIRDKRIVQFTLSSGHYRPTTEHGKNLHEFLVEQVGTKKAKEFPIQSHH